MAAQSIILSPMKKTNKISFCKIELSTEYIKTLIRKPIAFDKKYVWIPNINIPTILLNNPKNWAPLNPNDDLNKTTNGNPNFWDGFPIKLENMKTKKFLKLSQKGLQQYLNYKLSTKMQLVKIL